MHPLSSLWQGVGAQAVCWQPQVVPVSPNACWTQESAARVWQSLSLALPQWLSYLLCWVTEKGHQDVGGQCTWTGNSLGHLSAETADGQKRARLNWLADDIQFVLSAKNCYIPNVAVTWIFWRGAVVVEHWFRVCFVSLKNFLSCLADLSGLLLIERQLWHNTCLVSAIHPYTGYLGDSRSSSTLGLLQQHNKRKGRKFFCTFYLEVSPYIQIGMWLFLMLRTRLATLSLFAVVRNLTWQVRTMHKNRCKKGHEAELKTYEINSFKAGPCWILFSRASSYFKSVSQITVWLPYKGKKSLHLEGWRIMAELMAGAQPVLSAHLHLLCQRCFYMLWRTVTPDSAGGFHRKSPGSEVVRGSALCCPETL